MFLDHHFGFLLLKHFPSFVCRESMIEDIINERPLIKHHHHRYGSKVNRFKTMVVVLVGWALQWCQDTNILQYWTWTIQLYTRTRHRLSMWGFSIFKTFMFTMFWFNQEFPFVLILYFPLSSTFGWWEVGSSWLYSDEDVHWHWCVQACTLW